MNKKFLLILIPFLFISCNKNIDLHKSFKNEILNLNSENFNDILKKYNIKSFKDIKIKDQNYYYVYAKIFYNKLKHDKWTHHFIREAAYTDNIFKKEALLFYTQYLIENNSYNALKKVLKENKEYLEKENLSFLLNYLNNKNFSTIDIDNIPNNPEYFDLIFEIIKKYPEQINSEKNKIKLHNYIISSKIYENRDEKIQNKIKNIINWNKKDYFLSCLFYGNLKNKKEFIKNLDYYFKYSMDISEVKLQILRSLSISLGIRKSFYNLISKSYKKNKILEYYYGIEVIYFDSYSKGLKILKNTLDHFNENSLINYNIRYKILYSTRSLNKHWIQNAVNFCNNYPDYYKSKILLNYIYRSTLLQRKESIVAPLLSNINYNTMNTLERSIFLYKMYLMDAKNKKKWYNILINKYPLSYGALTITNGKIINNINLKDEEIINKDFIKPNYKTYYKIKYLLEYELFDEAKNIKHENISKNEQIAIYELFYNYYINNKDYFNALKVVEKQVSLYYDDNQYKIDNINFIKRLYPLHFKEHVLKYSDQFNIENSLAYAVMREESYFKYNIKSYQNAHGLMQIMPSTGEFIAKKLKLKEYDLNNPEQNIMMGIYYLDFLKRYFDDKQLLLSCYNAGQGNTKKWFRRYKKYPPEKMYEVLPIYETRHYIRKVMNSYFVYNYILDIEKSNN